MKKQQIRIQKKNKPESDDELVSAFKDLKTLYDSEGGQIVVCGLIDDVVGAMNVLAGNYKTMPHTEMIGYCAAIHEKLQMIRLLSRSEENYKQLSLELLDQALRE